VSTSVPGNEDRLPRRFGRYLLFDKIGEGGMARIYLGRTKTDLGGERLAVVKQILPMLSSSSEFSRLLIDEAKLAARLSHGNVVQVFDLGREDEVLYIAMEYVEGFDLRQLLLHCSKTSTPLPIEFALLVIVQTLRALDFAHRKRDDEGKPLGIVHRDVSPSNVLLSFDGEVKLCDFGIARAIGAGFELPPEAIQGKAGYMSPEAAGGDPLDARSDVFSAGIMLWELVAGRRLYGKTATIDRAREAEVPPLPVRGYPDEEKLHAIVSRALERDRERRFASARDMLRELEDYVRSANLVASPLRFGEWLTEQFGREILDWRKARERAAKALEAGPLVELRPLASAPEAAPPAAAAAAKNAELAAPKAGAPPGERPSQKFVLMVIMVVFVVGALVGAYVFR
jgi:eukaryotic-like serine/threonine-protein kinase